jgi:hypothetical protein
MQPRRSTRQRTSRLTAAARQPAPPSVIETAAPKKQPTAKPTAAAKKPKAKGKGQRDDAEDGTDSDGQPAPHAAGDMTNRNPNGVEAEAKQAEPAVTETGTSQVQGQGRQYWLMKAEPESRIENGVDVKFSIDDLAAKSEPEPWDG